MCAYVSKQLNCNFSATQHCDQIKANSFVFLIKYDVKNDMLGELVQTAMK